MNKEHGQRGKVRGGGGRILQTSILAIPKQITYTYRMGSGKYTLLFGLKESEISNMTSFKFI